MELMSESDSKLKMEIARRPGDNMIDVRSCGMHLPPVRTGLRSEGADVKCLYSSPSNSRSTDSEIQQALKQWPTFHQMWLELGKQRPIGVPIAAMNVMWFTRFIVSTMFLGRLGGLQLAGGTMALTFANVTGFSILMGLAGGMEPICGQAYGARRYKIMGITLQRGILILLLTSFPIALVWWNVEVLLLAIGQDPAIAKIANDYLRYLLPDLLATALLSPLRIFLRSQCITKPMMVCSGLAMLLHIPINSLLVFGCGLGAPGTAVANFWTDVNMIVFLLIYVKYAGVCQYTWPGWSKACLREWRPLLRLALPSCFMTCLEWWCYEIMMMLAGLLSDARKSIAIMAIVLNGDTILYALQVALASCVCTRVGNELGANRPLGAYHASIAALGLSIGLGCIGTLWLIGERSIWGKLFTTDQQILLGVAEILPIMGLCELGNFPQTVSCGVLRGSARPAMGAYVNLGSFYLVGIPMSLLLGFVFKLGLLGLWLGLLAAVMTCAVLTVTAVIRTDWVVQALRAQDFTLMHDQGASSVVAELEHSAGAALSATSALSCSKSSLKGITCHGSSILSQQQFSENEVLLLKRSDQPLAGQGISGQINIQRSPLRPPQSLERFTAAMERLIQRRDLIV